MRHQLTLGIARQVHEQLQVRLPQLSHIEPDPLIAPIMCLHRCRESLDRLVTTNRVRPGEPHLGARKSSLVMD
jgi:hypothetical protein